MTDRAPDATPPLALPGLDCGSCGSATCAEFARRMKTDPRLAVRCIYLSPALASDAQRATQHPLSLGLRPAPPAAGLDGPAAEAGRGQRTWRDTLDREFDFYLECLPQDPGPREIILPHNPLLTRELDVSVGDQLVGRPLGMSCGCPITHCGVALEVDRRTGVIVWCVTGPLAPRQNGFKDLGYYVAEAYEGLVRDARCDLRIGARYFFQPRMCMLQWRHSGLINFISHSPDGLHVRLEGLWIG